MNSEVFAIVAKLDQKRFLVHEGVMAAQSEALWVDACNQIFSTSCGGAGAPKVIELDGHDGDTVGRLVEFLYQGDYVAPDPVPKKPAEPTHGPPPYKILEAMNTAEIRCAANGWPIPTLFEEPLTPDVAPKPEWYQSVPVPEVKLNAPPAKIETPVPVEMGLSWCRLRRQKPAEMSLLAIRHPQLAADQPPIEITRPESCSSAMLPDPQAALEKRFKELSLIGQNSSEAMVFHTKHFDPAGHDYRDVLLAHAKVCALAHEKEVTALETLSMQRLLRTLLSIGAVKAEYSITKNFVELLEYLNSHSTNKTLRKMVVEFWALNSGPLTSKGIEEFILVTGRGGELAREMLGVVFKNREVSFGQLEPAASSSDLASSVTEADRSVKAVGAGDTQIRTVQKRLGQKLMAGTQKTDALIAEIRAHKLFGLRRTSINKSAIECT